MRAILLTDIDDSLMSTARKLPGADGYRVGAFDSKGRPSSFMSPRHEKLWDLLRNAVDAQVPVTARSPEALARVQLAFTDGAVCDFGATVLDGEGALDADWHRQMSEQSATLRQDRVFDALIEVVAGTSLLKTEYRHTNGIPVFVNFRCEPGAANASLRELVGTAIRELGVINEYYLHLTDRDVTVLPRFITKAAAARHVVQKLGHVDSLVLALGDSLSDAGFMTEADFFLVPGKSRAADALKGAAIVRGELP